MKLVGFVVAYNEAENGNLERCLANLASFCDDIVVCDDASTDNSVEVAKRFTDHVLVMPKHHGFPTKLQKARLLDLALEQDPDWIFWLDADEILERRGVEGELRKLCTHGDKEYVGGYLFREIELWRNQCWYRTDGPWGESYFCRLWKNTGHLQFTVETYLHPRPYPLGLGRIQKCDLNVIHYGFSSLNHIVDKYLTYKRHGQHGWQLNRLIDEESIKLQGITPEWFPKPNFPKIQGRPPKLSPSQWQQLIDDHTKQ